MTVMALFPEDICTLLTLSMSFRRAAVAGVSSRGQQLTWKCVTTNGSAFTWGSALCNFQILVETMESMVSILTFGFFPRP